MLKQIFAGRPNTENITLTYLNGYITNPNTLQKVNLAKDIKQENVKFVESIERQYFLVKSSTIGKCYKVNLGNEDTFPRCKCDVWKRSLLLCKHMVSISEYFPEFGWESLPWESSFQSDGNHYQSPTKLRHTLI